jgi:hypothetical protein
MERSGSVQIITEPVQEAQKHTDPTDPEHSKNQLPVRTVLNVIFGKCDICCHGIRIQTSWTMIDPDPYLYNENPMELQPWQILYYTVYTKCRYLGTLF